MSISLGAPVLPAHPRSDTSLRWAEAGGKRFFVMRQKGALADVSYDHGALLAAEIEGGVFPEIVDTIRTGTDTASDTLDWILKAVYRRLSDGVFDACAAEFRAAVTALGDGMFDTLRYPKFTPEDVRDALVAIDTGNLADGLTRRMEKPLAAEATETILWVLGAVRRYRRGRPPSGTDAALDDRAGLGRGMQRLGAMDRRVGFGCTAAGAAPGLTADGLGLHARNFDGAFFDWNKHPGIFIVDERATNPAWHRYVGVGTAGLIYAGGISGLNDAGLACSIHQMSTAVTDEGRPGRGYALAPYLQQRILREAASLDEAEAVLRGARHFAAWTIVVSDAKAGKAARFEIAAGKRVMRTDLGDRFAQSNHFLAPDLTERFDHFGDAHFTPSFGKWLESRARLKTVEAAFEVGRPGTDWAIRLLGGHEDGALGGRVRSFGRTICKAYGLMGTVARTDPDRARARDEIWFAIGDAVPGPHAHFAGFAVDWEALELRPVADRPLRRAGALSAEMTEATAEYVAAFRTLARPEGAGGYLGRDPDEGERLALLAKAIGHLDRAAAVAEDAGEMDFAFRYARARLCHAAGDYAAAEVDWAFLRDLADRDALPMHDWERALVLILSAATGQACGDPAAAGWLAEGRAMLVKVRRAEFGQGRAHPDIAAWEAAAGKLAAGQMPDLPEFDFVTVE